ncbi:MAG: 5-formyltetrahydrofolate cyclo-ligase [Nitrospirota bacterium]|nr:5-formyltetrahydrofolate cyclo-ligase [Nitrospirota bacterium]
MDTAQEKDTLRRRIRSWRDGLSAAEVDILSEEVESRLVHVAAFQQARTLLVYAHIGSEVRTSALMARALLTGKRLVLPRVAGDRLLLFQVKNPVHDLAPAGRWGIPEPKDTCAPVEPDQVDMFLLPGLAFDPAGNRLGYGRGFFDRLLGGCPGYKVALALDGQIVETVPVGPGDCPVDAVISPTRVIACSGRVPGGTN